jgi:hypothetical protein
LYIDPLGLDTTSTKVDKDGNMQVKANPDKGDVVKVQNEDGSTSYYTYDPKSKDANEAGYTGSGTESTLSPVTVTPQRKDNGGMAGVAVGSRR